MISETLKDYKPGDKPRFFLHDEVKQWLKDNLKVTVQSGDKPLNDPHVSGMLNAAGLVEGHSLFIQIAIDNELICDRFCKFENTGYPQALKTLTNVMTSCMQQINQLHAENEELRKRIELLETPLPV